MNWQHWMAAGNVRSVYLTLKRKSRYSHLNPPSPISIDHEPQKTTRIRGDGNVSVSAM